MREGFGEALRRGPPLFEPLLPLLFIQSGRVWNVVLRLQMVHRPIPVDRAHTRGCDHSADDGPSGPAEGCGERLAGFDVNSVGGTQPLCTAVVIFAVYEHTADLPITRGDPVEHESALGVRSRAVF